MASEIKRLRAEVEEVYICRSRVSLELAEARRQLEEERRQHLKEQQQLKDELMHAEARAECLGDQVVSCCCCCCCCCC
ncbi:hypothetical protein, conserved [Eimeria tenella]|uniref:Uncharacterized protein n=1 Tax=Eimeria tenella TaxID=5802 RepID=U6L0C6_EIMTE|nr:hypothetical protein, conserved [Eimeria tenella]CDJ41215.1 hypothetical protein, conserved [Eimeria tenella]|eukprot:XP_013231965.1 hypothetical protein, conserved [Eimeria tenella]